MTINDCATAITVWKARLPTSSAPRRTGEVSSRSITPRFMSSMSPAPARVAVITTMPGVM